MLHFKQKYAYNGTFVSQIYMDTGCSSIIVSKNLLSDDDVANCKTVELSDYLGRNNKFPVAKCYFSCDFFVGFVNVVRAPIDFFSILVVNVPGVTKIGSTISHSDVSCTTEILNGSQSSVNAIHIRASSRTKAVHPLIAPDLEPLNITSAKFS